MSFSSRSRANLAPFVDITSKYEGSLYKKFEEFFNTVASYM